MAANMTNNESEVHTQDTKLKVFTSNPMGSDANVKTILPDAIHPNFMMRNNYFIRRGVPESHRKVADNYMIIKRVFGNPVIQSQVTDSEKLLLSKYDFAPLELTTAKQIEDELCFLKKWSYSRNRELQEAADQIIQIRAKELKYLIATNYVNTKKNFDGYKTLEKYFEEISKYFSKG